MRHTAVVIGWALVVAALAAGGCATVPAVDAQGLALRKVVVYRNGVGYFERAGRVDSSEVQFKVRKNEIGDFLATLAVLERGGSSVRSASFPLAVDDEKPTPPPVPGPDMKGDTKGPAARISDLQTVTMGLDGREHDLQVGYIAATPIWRPSYRLVLDKNGATLQVWGIVQNLSGEDWRDVQLSLIAEAPLAFETSLATAVIPQRPTVSDGGEVMAVIPRSETSLAQDGAPAPAPPSAEMAAPGSGMSMKPQAAPSMPRRKSAAPVGRSPMSGGVGAMEGGGGEYLAAPLQDYSGRTRNLSALAAIALQAGATRYDLPARVTIPDKSATMVMLLDRPIPGEAISLYAPDSGVPESASHPFRVARMTNKTGGLLERGPLAIFEEGAFLGQGMTDALPDGATATVPFALERTLAVDKDREFREEGARIFKIEGGVLTIARDTVTVTKYRLRNGAERPAKLLLKHPRVSGARLIHPPAGTEDNVGTGTALIPAALSARATVTLPIDERQQTVRTIDWLDPLADDAVRGYMADTRADQAVVKALRGAWAIRQALKAATDEHGKLAVEEADLRRATDETRNNLKALEKNKAAGDLRAKLTDRLAADSARLDQVSKRTVEVDLAMNEQRVRFSDAIRGIKLTAVPQP